MNTHTLHIVLGDQPNPDGTISAGHTARLEAVLNKAKPEDIVITTGGITVSGALSEAELGEEYLRQRGLPTTVGIDLETDSRTTVQNFANTKATILMYPNDRLIVYCGHAQLFKARLLRLWHWPITRSVRFVALPDYRGIGYILAQLTIGTALALLDPYEVWVARLTTGKAVRKTVLE